MLVHFLECVAKLRVNGLTGVLSSTSSCIFLYWIIFQVNSCLYLSKKLSYCEMRTQVNELWSKGEKVTCGVVTEDTRVKSC